MTHQKPLPPSLMGVITRTIEADDIPIQERFEAVVLITHGYGLYSQTEEVDPTQYAIPESQWTGISQAFIDAAKRAGGSDISQVNYALSWMNSGPTTYKVEPEPTFEDCEAQAAYDDEWIGRRS